MAGGRGGGGCGGGGGRIATHADTCIIMPCTLPARHIIVLQHLNDEHVVEFL